MVIVVSGVSLTKKDSVGSNGHVRFEVKGNPAMFHSASKARIPTYFVTDFVIGNNLE